MIIGVVLMAHDLIHLIGFVVPWKIATLESFRYRTNVLSDVEIGTTGVKALGPFWLVAASGFVIVGVALLGATGLLVAGDACGGRTVVDLSVLRVCSRRSPAWRSTW